MIRVRATREGLDGHRTSTGYRVDPHVPFVALPSTAALRLWIRIHNPLNNKVVRALVLDVGPWEEADHAYVFQPATMNHLGLSVPPDTIRPKAESGIDLGEKVWHDLDMRDNGEVEWELD